MHTNNTKLKKMALILSKARDKQNTPLLEPQVQLPQIPSYYYVFPLHLIKQLEL